MDDIKTFDDAEDLLLIEEKTIDENNLSYAEQKKRKNIKVSVQKKDPKPKYIKRHLYKSWDLVGAPRDSLPDPNILEIFLKARMEEYLGLA